MFCSRKSSSFSESSEHEVRRISTTRLSCVCRSSRHGVRKCSRQLMAAKAACTDAHTHTHAHEHIGRTGTCIVHCRHACMHAYKHTSMHTYPELLSSPCVTTTLFIPIFLVISSTLVLVAIRTVETCTAIPVCCVRFSCFALWHAHALSS